MSESEMNEKETVKEDKREQPKKDSSSQKCCEKKEGFDVGAIIWGFIFIFVGGVFLLNSLNVLTVSWSFFGNLFRFWPIILVLIGLNILIGKSSLGRYIGTIISVIIVGLVLIFTLFFSTPQLTNFFNDKIPWWSNVNIFQAGELLKKTETVAEEDYEDQVITSRNMTIDIGISEFTISDDVDNEDYFAVSSQYYDNFGVPKFTHDLNNNILDLNFTTESQSVFNFGSYTWEKVKYDFTFGKTSVPTNFEIDLGTGSGEVDFQKLNVNNFKTEVGTGSIEIQFGEQAVPTGKIESKVGTGKTVIELPEELGLKITHEIGIGSITVDGKDVDKNGTYYTEGYDQANQKVELDLKVGTGSIEIVRN